ncbi:MAG: hypothetical protein NVS3B24_20380 [Candidatus Dormibacteria bacterium]
MGRAADVVAEPARLDPLVRPEADEASRVAKFFRGLGDPTRVRILEYLDLHKEATVGELVNAVGGLQGRVSSHLGCLRWCGLVQDRRDGRLVYYRLADPRIRRLLKTTHEFLGEHGDQVELCRIIDRGPE